MNKTVERKREKVKRLREAGASKKMTNQVLRREFGRGMTNSKITEIEGKTPIVVKELEVQKKKTVIKNLPAEIGCSSEKGCLMHYERHGRLICFNPPYALTGGCERYNQIKGGVAKEMEVRNGLEDNKINNREKRISGEMKCGHGETCARTMNNRQGDRKEGE